MADTEYLKELTKKALIRSPSISGRELGQLLSIDKDTALKIRDEVIGENKKRIAIEIENLKKRTLEEELVDMEQEAKELITELWKIISSNTSSAKDKNGAIRNLLSARKQLFDVKFDAGLFIRKLGEVGVSMGDLVKLVEDNAKPKPESDPDSQAGNTQS